MGASISRFTRTNWEKLETRLKMTNKSENAGIFDQLENRNENIIGFREAERRKV